MGLEGCVLADYRAIHEALVLKERFEGVKHVTLMVVPAKRIVLVAIGRSSPA